MRSVLVFSALLLFAGCTGKDGVPEPAATVETVEYPSRNDTVRGIVYRPAGQGPFPAVVVLHGDAGLTTWEKEQAQRLCDLGYVALAVDLYRGQVVSGVLDAHIMERGLPEDRALADLKAAVDYLVSRPDVRGDAFGIVGWDMGGGYALDAARHDSRLRAVVVCYGRLTTDPEWLASLQASVLGIFAEKDEGISPETIAQFRAAMRKAGKRIADLHIYRGCGPGFMNPASPHATDAPAIEATADAWNKIENYLAAELKQRP